MGANGPDRIGFGLSTPFRREAADFAGDSGGRLVEGCVRRVLGVRGSGWGAAGEYPWRRGMGSSLDRLGGDVVVRFRSGKVYSHKVDIAKGDPRNPMSWKEVYSKYRDCTRLALTEEDTERSLNLVLNLESVSDITEVMDLLTLRCRM